MHKTNSRTWTVQDAARELGYTESYIEQLCAKDKLESKKVKGKWVIYDLEIHRIGHEHRSRNTAITYLKTLTGATGTQQRAINAVVEMLEGGRAFGEMAQLVKQELNEQGEINTKEFYEKYKIGSCPAITMALWHLHRQGKIKRIGVGHYVSQ